MEPDATNATEKPQRPRKQREWMPAFLQAWEATGCNWSASARAAGIDRSTAIRAADRNAAFAAKLRELRPHAVEQVEDVLFKKCLAGDMRAIEFWLKAHAADRYREQVDVNFKLIAKLAAEMGLDTDEVLAEAEALVRGG